MTELLHPHAAGFRIDGSSGEAIVAVHGFTGNPAHLRMLAADLNGRLGHTVIAPRLPGHGTSLEDMASTGWLDWYGAVHAAVGEALRDAARLHLFGFSMGGLLAMIAAGRFPTASLATLNTPVVNRDPRVYAARWWHRIQPFRPWAEGGAEPEGPNREYWLHYEGYPVRGLAEMRRVRDEALRTAGRIDAPTLVVQSRADETVAEHNAEALVAALFRASTTIVWLDRSAHNALFFDEAPVVHERLAAHMTGASAR